MNKVIVAPKAQGDLLEIRDYISDELQNTTAAKKAVAKITKKIRILQEHALIGAPLAPSPTQTVTRGFWSAEAI